MSTPSHRSSAGGYLTRDNNGLWGQQDKLFAPDGSERDYFGYSASISGNSVIIGSYGNDDYGARSGSAYMFALNSSTPNAAPVALNDTVEPIKESDTVFIDVLANDHDFDGSLDTTSISINTPPTNGTITINPVNGQITYSHNGSSTIRDSFTYSVKDNEEAVSNIAIVNITIAPRILTCNKSVSLDGNDWINIPDIPLHTLEGGLPNDKTNDFTIEAWIKLAPGITSLDALLGQEGIGLDINFHQQKMRLFTGYGDAVVSNSLIQENKWTHVAITGKNNLLSLYINGELDATGQYANALPIKALGRGNRSLLGNFKGEIDEVRIWFIARSPSEIALHYNTSVDPSIHGLLQYWNFNGTGQTVTNSADSFIWPNYGGDGSLGVGVDEGNDDPTRLQSTAPIFENCESNLAPIANDDSAGPIEPGQFAIINLPANDNDNDSDGSIDFGSIIITTAPINGSIIVDEAGTGEIVYTHDGSATTSDSFTYTVTDDQGALSNEATVSITITSSPIADCGKAIELDGINDWINIPDLTLANDFTIEGWFKLAPGIDYKDAIFGQEGSGPDIHFSAGKVRLYAYGIRVTAKTPLIADTWGHIAITRSGSNLTVYVNGVKDATGRWNGSLSIKAIGRGNRGFAKGMLDEIRIWEIARTEAEISNHYDISVDPNAAGLLGYWNFNKSDQIITDASSFANHGSLGTNTATGTDDPIRLNSAAPLTENCNGVEITNVPPVAIDDVAGVVEAGAVFSFNVTDNDTDSDGNLNPTSVVIVSDPSFGIATVNTDGTIKYISTGITATTDILKYTVADSEGETSNKATVTIGVLGPVFEPGTPIANDDAIGPVVAGGTITFSVTDNDLGSNADLLQASVSIVSISTEGSATVNGDGTITYVNNSTTAAFDTLTYTVSDINGLISNQAIVSITITEPEPAVNEAPIAQSDTAHVQSGKSVTIEVLFNDSDSDGTIDKSSLIIVEEPTWGTVEIDSTTGEIIYLQDKVTLSNDSFTYSVKDNLGAVSNDAIVEIKNDAINKLLARDGSELDNFGYSVSISGDTAIIGADGDNDNNLGAYSGSAYIFIRSGNESWSQQAKLAPDDLSVLDQFGHSVSISGDTAAVGAFGNDIGKTGAVYIFVRNDNGEWNQQAKLVVDGSFIFGGSVSISEDTVAISALASTSASESERVVYIFVRDENNNWNQQAKLIATDNDEPQAVFGHRVSISGDTVAISNYVWAGTGGSVYIFARHATGEWNLQSRLASDNINDYFGWSLSISENTTVIGATSDHQGAAYVYVRDANNIWSQQTKLEADNSSSYNFGSAVAISENKMVIRAYTGNTTSSGRAAEFYVFGRNGNGEWSQKTKIIPTIDSVFGSFGNSVSISGDTTIIGAYLDDKIVNNAGLAFIVDLKSTASSCGKGIELDGINDWVNIPNISLANDFTIEGWFKLAPGIDYKDAIFGQEGSGPDIHFSAGRVRLYAYGIRVTAKTPLIADTWGHIAITRLGSELTVYINGVKDATGRWNGPLSIKAIGRGNRGYAKGMIDEVRIWELARTDAEIGNSYKTSVNPNSTGLIGYWNFNDTDQTITDASSSAIHGSLGASTAIGADDPVRLDSTAPLAENCEGGQY